MYPSSLPNIDLQVLPTFPAHVGVTGVLTLVKSGLSYTFGVNFQNVIEETNVSDMSKREVLVQDTDTGAFWRVKLTNLPTGQTDWANIQNKPATFPPSPHTHPVAEISDATVTGQSLVTAADAAAARAAIGAVNRAGDVMTGQLRVPTTLFVDAGNSSANAHLQLCDENGVSRGTVYWDRALNQVWLVLHDATGALVNSIRLSATGATIGTSPIWTDANKQIADGQVLGNVSGSTGVPVGVTLSALLDKISNTRGAVLYRGASGWAALGPGAAGQVLTSGGAGADPSWQDTAVGVDALIPPEFVAGLTLSNNAGDPNNDIDIAPGRARGSGVTVEISSTITKRLDANWSEGDGEGGLDTGSKAANATYHVFVIRKDDDGTGDVLLSTSATSPTVPVGWTLVQRLGAVLTDGSGNIRPFVQTGNEFRFDVTDPAPDYSGTGNRAKAPLTCTLPNGIRVQGIFSVFIRGASGDYQVRARLFDGANANIASTTSVYVTTGFKASTAELRQYTNTSRQIQLLIDQNADPSNNSTVTTVGWIDYQIPRIGA